MSYVSEYDALDDPKTQPDALEGKNVAHRHVMADRVWLVLARREYEKPLQQVGTVEADDPELARVYARSIYDEFAWIEMVVVPRDMVVTVIAS
jgi:1,2-phenylacetyl-CoA epoxidase PaaB subunit